MNLIKWIKSAFTKKVDCEDHKGLVGRDLTYFIETDTWQCRVCRRAVDYQNFDPEFVDSAKSLAEWNKGESLLPAQEISAAPNKYPIDNA